MRSLMISKRLSIWLRLLVFCFIATLTAAIVRFNKIEGFQPRASQFIIEKGEWENQNLDTYITYANPAYTKDTAQPRFLKHNEIEFSTPVQHKGTITVHPAHPRLFGVQARWNKLPRLFEIDPYLSSWNNSVFTRADDWYSQQPLRYSPSPEEPLDGNGVLDVAREMQQRIKLWAYAFRLSGDPRWKDRIWKELLVASGNSTQSFGQDGDNWNSRLDVGEFLLAFSYAYDWLYDAWNQYQRKAIMWSIVSLGLKKGLEAYESNTWFLSVRGNWNCVTNGGMITGSLAVYHEDETGVARMLLPRAIENARKYCAQAVESDGTWTETPDYWYFGTQAHAQLSSALLTATGQTHGMLTANPAFKDTGWFHIYSNGMTGNFNYGDCGPLKFTATANSLLFYGDAFRNPSFILYQRDRPDVADPISILWYNPSIEGLWYHALPLDRDFPDPNGAWVSMRSSWTNLNGLFVAMKGGKMVGHQNHGNLDAGDFVLDALGERWAGELCQDNYLSPGYFSGESQDSDRWTYYRCGTHGQNTIVYNDRNQAIGAIPKTRFGTTEAGQAADAQNPVYNTGFWVADLSSAFSGPTIQRGVRLLQGRQQILIQDEITSARFGSQWRMHTNASVTYSNNRRTAHLRLNGKQMDVFIDSPPALYFYSQQAVRTKNDLRLPPGASDESNPNVTVLTVDIPAGNTTVAIRFSPQWGRGWQATVPPIVVDLASWSLDSHGAA